TWGGGAWRACSLGEDSMALRKFIIERDIPAVGSLEREQLRGAAAKSNEVLRQLGPDIQWVDSYVAADKTFCVYLAQDEAIIKKHAEISGFPATKITENGTKALIITGHAFTLPDGMHERYEFLLKPVRAAEIINAVHRALTA